MWTRLVAGAAAHEINNLAQGLFNLLSLATSSPAPSDALDRYAGLARDGIQDLRQLGTDLRTLANPGGGDETHRLDLPDHRGRRRAPVRRESAPSSSARSRTAALVRAAAAHRLAIKAVDRYCRGGERAGRPRLRERIARREDGGGRRRRALGAPASRAGRYGARRGCSPATRASSAATRASCSRARWCNLPVGGADLGGTRARGRAPVHVEPPVRRGEPATKCRTFGGVTDFRSEREFWPIRIYTPQTINRSQRRWCFDVAPRNVPRKTQIAKRRLPSQGGAGDRGDQVEHTRAHADIRGHEIRWLVLGCLSGARRHDHGATSRTGRSDGAPHGRPRARRPTRRSTLVMTKRCGESPPKAC